MFALENCCNFCLLGGIDVQKTPTAKMLSADEIIEENINNDPVVNMGDSIKEDVIVGTHGQLLGSTRNTLQKRLGLSHGVSLLVGLILGSGVFISPQLIASQTTSNGMMPLVWLIAGLIAAFGSLCYCEIACILKMSGGNYANMLHIYGKVPAFLCCWTTCLVIDPAALAAIALTIGLYITKPFLSLQYEHSELIQKFIAGGLLCISCIVNCISVNLTTRVQKLFVFAQLSAVLFIVSLGIWQLAEGKVENFHGMFNGTHLDAGSVVHLGIAVLGGLWSFDGWALLNNVVEEIHNIERNLLLIVVIGFPIIIACYLSVNISFLTILSRAEMAASEAVGVDFVENILGMKAAMVMMILVALSSYGTLNGTTFSCPRLTLAASREGHMPSFLSLISKRSSSPIPAIILLTAMALILLTLPASNLNSLILLFSQAQWLMYCASIFGVVVLRLQRPNIARPVKVFIGIPILLSLFSLFLVIVPFFQHPYQSFALTSFILLGLPVYLIFIHFNLSLPMWCLRGPSKFTLFLQRYCGLIPCEKQDT